MPETPILIDLYAGVGGLSLGAARAGFTVAAAVELDDIAVRTHRNNFPQSVHIHKDVSKLSGKDILRTAGIKKGSISGIVGGPPCQGFSTMGRRDPNDTRNSLFVEFFRLVRELQPAFFVAENVPGILSERFDPIRAKAYRTLGRGYITLDPVKVIANEYGAPTTRKRILFIGYKPTAIARDFQVSDFLPSVNEPVRVREALMGLPKDISDNWQDFASGCRKLGKMPSTEFHTRVIDKIPKGVGSETSIRLLFEKELVTGCLGTKHTPAVIRRFKNLAAGEQDTVSKAIRLDPAGFCPTLRAGTGSDRGSFQSLRPIHYLRPRVITPREAARLQGFPDWFQFHETKWHSFRQIGNSVSPIVAEKILSAIMKLIR